MNRVILMGRLTKDPEVFVNTVDKKEVVSHVLFTIAVDREYGGEDGKRQADFINCVAFGKMADNIDKFFSKGMKILVEGRWSTGSYKNKDGYTVYTNQCTVFSFEFCDSKKKDDVQEDQQQDHAEETTSKRKKRND